jgi:hypothetical protein
VYVTEANRFAGFMGFKFGLTRSSLDEPGVFDQDGKYGEDDCIQSEFFSCNTRKRNVQKVDMPAKTKKRAKLGIHAPLPVTRVRVGRTRTMLYDSRSLITTWTGFPLPP